ARSLQGTADRDRRYRIRGRGVRTDHGGHRVSEPAKSVAFDRAASFYDQTRTLSPEAAKRVTDLLSDELAGVERALEIGVGTGRIALPLVDAGVRLVGVDLSAPMLA